MNNAKPRRIYLAGPMVFFQNHPEVFKELKDTCAKYGLEGVSPLDNELNVSPGSSPWEVGVQIYRGNMDCIRSCAAVVANMQPFRGEEPDSGTCFEVGVAAALNMPVALYGPQMESTAKDLLAASCGIRYVEGKPVDCVFEFFVEDFDMPVNLMMVGAASAYAVSFEKALVKLATAQGWIA